MNKETYDKILRDANANIKGYSGTQQADKLTVLCLAEIAFSLDELVEVLKGPEVEGLTVRGKDGKTKKGQ